MFSESYTEHSSKHRDYLKQQDVQNLFKNITKY